jgi:hypothetical protein
MKLFKPKHNQGLALITLIILFVLFVIFIGTVAYILWRAIQRIPPRPNPPDEQMIIQQAIDDEIALLQTEYATQNISVQSVGVAHVPVNIKSFIPFSPVEYGTVVEKSTNLINWEYAATITSSNTFVDTNILDKAFYRRFDLLGNPVQNNTNHIPGFYYVPQ